MARLTHEEWLAAVNEAAIQRFDCRTCLTPRGWPCVTQRGRPARTHTHRWNLGKDHVNRLLRGAP